MRSYKEALTIALAALIAAPLASALVTRISAKAAEEICSENLRKIYALALAWQDANNGGIVPGVEKWERWRFWFSRLLPLAKSPACFYCPEKEEAKVYYERYLGEHQNPLLEFEPPFFDRAQSYGMNFKLFSEYNSGGVDLNIKNIADPSYTVYFGDSKTPFLRPTAVCWERDYAPRHFDKSNFVFMDGHTELLSGSDIGLYDKIPGSRQDRKRWDNWKNSGGAPRSEGK